MLQTMISSVTLSTCYMGWLFLALVHTESTMRLVNVQGL